MLRTKRLNFPHLRVYISSLVIAAPVTGLFYKQSVLSVPTVPTSTACPSIVFHAGTAAKGSEVLTAGGRVLAVTSLGNSITEATEQSYDTISGIAYDGKYFRRDIGRDLL